MQGRLGPAGEVEVAGLARGAALRRGGGLELLELLARGFEINAVSAVGLALLKSSRKSAST